MRQAEPYVKCGWSIIPIRNDPKTGRKPAACGWKQYQQRRPTDEELMLMSKLRGLTGLAAVLGRVSRGLWSRDFDVPEAYHLWATAFPELAKRMPTYQTGRGFQILAYHSDDVFTKDLGDGELRGESVYSLLPYSLHPNERCYQWVVGGPESLVAIEPGTAGLSRPWLPPPKLKQRETEEAEGPEASEVSEGADVVREDPTSAGALGGVVALTIIELVRMALPGDEHQNHAKLFLLARGLRAFEERDGRQWSENEMKTKLFLPWYKQNGFLRDSQTQAEYWLEFLEARDDVKYPLGESMLEQTWRLAVTSDPPSEAQRFRDPRSQRLVAWCRELQRAAGEKPFFLSCRTVSSKLGLKSSRGGSVFLRRLEREGFLAVVEKGGPNTNRATRFRYMDPDLGL